MALGLDLGAAEISVIKAVQDAGAWPGVGEVLMLGDLEPDSDKARAVAKLHTSCIIQRMVVERDGSQYVGWAFTQAAMDSVRPRFALERPMPLLPAVSELLCIEDQSQTEYQLFQRLLADKWELCRRDRAARGAAPLMPPMFTRDADSPRVLWIGPDAHHISKPYLRALCYASVLFGRNDALLAIGHFQTDQYYAKVLDGGTPVPDPGMGALCDDGDPLEDRSRRKRASAPRAPLMPRPRRLALADRDEQENEEENEEVDIESELGRCIDDDENEEEESELGKSIYRLFVLIC
jgi:hypothetical protein